MIDLSSIPTILSSLDIASKFVKGSINKIKDNAVREKVEELLNSIDLFHIQITSLYESNLALYKSSLSHIVEKETLEKKLKELEDWTIEEASHELDEVTTGVKLYIKKSSGEIARPIEHFCPNCFNIHHKKSIIQFSHTDSLAKAKRYFCPNCPFKVDVPYHIHNENKI